MTRPSPLGVVLRFFRFAGGLSEAEAARVLGMSPSALSRLERGNEGSLSRSRLEELLALLDVPPEAVDPALLALEVAFSNPEPSTTTPVDPTPAERRTLRRAAVRSGSAAAEATQRKLTANLRKVKAAEARRQAAALWKSLRALPSQRRRAAVETERRLWSWALAERLCEESVRAAAHRADEAVELSRLAQRVAELVPGGEAWRTHLLGWVWAFVANACRVQGDLPAAEEGFLRSDALLAAGRLLGPTPLDPTRPLDLKASLRRYQGRCDEALELLEGALKAHGNGLAQARILINMANTLELMGDFERAIAELRQAETLAKGSRERRLAFVVQHSLIRNLFESGRYAEAHQLLPEARQAAVENGNELDLVRVLWAEGKVAASLGRREQAVRALEQARRYFNANRIAFDAALASLELAVLHLEEGRADDVKRLSEEMYWIFKAQGVPQEALAALRLFCEAAAKEEVTAEFTRRLLDYLAQARSQPELRFREVTSCPRDQDGH